MHELTLAPAVRKNLDPEYQARKNNAPAPTLGAIPPCSMKHLRRDAVWRGSDLPPGTPRHREHRCGSRLAEHVAGESG